jgi:hypothetical protein
MNQSLLEMTLKKLAIVCSSSYYPPDQLLGQSWWDESSDEPTFLCQACRLKWSTMATWKLFSSSPRAPAPHLVRSSIHDHKNAPRFCALRLPVPTGSPSHAEWARRGTTVDTHDQLQQASVGSNAHVWHCAGETFLPAKSSLPLSLLPRLSSTGLS